MPDDKNTVRLDRKWLESFLTEEVGPFRKQLEGLLENEPGTGVPSMWVLLGGTVDTLTLDQVKPLNIGRLANDDSFSGKHLNDSVRTSAESIDATVREQIDLFKSIEENLRDAMDVLFKTQGQSLEKIEGRQFLEHLEDVSDVLGGPGSADDTER
ncbi:type VII secretion system-associated protein [Streptomyces sp. AC627_RSS907]|uniref:type VII secretion system-associated protein n=1 Tax=Streptomyces sp. AC627_RSS907 TaxID=2823684 RepID=UPI001C2350D0|nr:type VII secretion system-associated protein [Streptomyces sp. AC627_RSS907]